MVARKPRALVLRSIWLSEWPKAASLRSEALETAMLNFAKFWAGRGRRPQFESKFQAAFGALCARCRSVVTVDQFGRESRVIWMIRAAIRIAVFCLAWKMVDSLFTLYWLISAVLALPATFIMMRVLKRLFAK